MGNDVDMTIDGLSATVSFLTPSIILLRKEAKLEKIRKKDKLAKKDQLAREQGFLSHQEKAFRSVKYQLTHVCGLPIMQGAICNVVSERDKIIIKSQGTVYSLNKERITYIGCETNIQKYTQAVSSVGGAALGGALFGAIGAAIGGSVKSRNFQSKRSYLVITYTDDDEALKYVIFDYIPRATTLIKDFKLFNKANLQTKTVEIK